MTEFAARGARRVHYLEHGDGPAVVLIPGLGGGARIFGTLPRRFARLGFRCLSVDPVGMPPSSELEGGYDFDAAALDLFAVLDHAGIARASLIGTSLGGKVALTAAALQPDRVDRLVMLASSAISTPRARRVYRFFELVADRLGPQEFAEAVAPFLFGHTFHSDRPAIVDDIIRATRPSAATRDLMIAQAHALRSFDGRARAAAITPPSLCIAGREDTLTGVDEVRATAEMLPNAEYLEIENAGHTLLLESAAVIDAVAAFCR